MKKIDILQDLIAHMKSLKFQDTDDLDLILRRSEMAIRIIFGENSKYMESVRQVQFAPSSYSPYEPWTNSELIDIWSNSQNSIINLYSTMIEELILAEALEQTSENSTIETQFEISNNIFIVHGHDEAMKLAVARTIEKLGLDPVILHEQPNTGRTIIEKFEDHSDVGFAVVLLSPDDKGFPKTDNAKNAKFRARQNVIFELGFFIGRLGRGRVTALYQDGVELPSDYDGVVYTKYDSQNGSWRFELVRELKACGYDVDANSLL
ncbi:MAG: nucleotide-binding protein [Anaerolineae bacterium]